jgi:hypothetical protein
MAARSRALRASSQAELFQDRGEAEPVLWARLASWTQTHPYDNATDALIMAIATAGAWLADETKLNRLITFVSTDIQRNHVEE